MRAEVFAARQRTFDAKAIAGLFDDRRKAALALLDTLDAVLADGRDTLAGRAYGPADVVWTVLLARLHWVKLAPEVARRTALARYSPSGSFGSCASGCSSRKASKRSHGASGPPRRGGSSMNFRRAGIARGTLALGALVASGAAGCGHAALVTAEALPVHRVVVYRNGVAYFESAGHVAESEVRFKMKRAEVGDFLATLAVMEKGGSSVRSAAFPLKGDEDTSDDADHPALTPDQKKGLETVVLSLDGREHDLQIGYVAESPVWRPSYRLVLSTGATADLEAWGIVENLSGEDWKNVSLSLVAGAPLAFRADLGTPTVPERPSVTDEGEVIAVVPHAETSLEQAPPPPPPGPAAMAPSPSEERDGAEAPASKSALGHGAGLGSGQGIGNGRGRLGGGHKAEAPRIREGSVTVNGRLPPEVVERIVRQNLGRFRLCYENGLRRDPNLQGRVSVRFAIDSSGSVATTSDGGSDLPDGGVVQCIVRGFGNLSFPQPQGGMVQVVYPMMFSPGDVGGDYAPPPPATYASTPQAMRPPVAVSPPRNVQALAAVAVEGGATKYDLPLPVTVPDANATMVLLVSRQIPGEAEFLFAPNGGVPDSSSHPFRVARFTNATDGALERGPIAIFEQGSFLGQGVVDPLPKGATATVPFALDRGVAVDVDHKFDQRGERVDKIEDGQLTVQRDRVTQTIYRIRNGGDAAAKVLVKHARVNGARLFAPPQGTEDNVGTGTALVPTTVAARATSELVVEERAVSTEGAYWFGAIAENAVKAYLADPKADAKVVPKLAAAWMTRNEIVKNRTDRADLEKQVQDLSRSTEETRNNLQAIEKNKTAEVLRKKLTARLADASTQLDELTKKVVELDAKSAELNVSFSEAVREIHVEVPPTTPAG